MTRKEFLKARISELEESIKFTNSMCEEQMDQVKDDIYELESELNFIEYNELNELGF